MKKLIRRILKEDWENQVPDYVTSEYIEVGDKVEVVTLDALKQNRESDYFDGKIGIVLDKNRMVYGERVIAINWLRGDGSRMGRGFNTYFEHDDDGYRFFVLNRES